MMKIGNETKTILNHYMELIYHLLAYKLSHKKFNSTKFGEIIFDVATKQNELEYINYMRKYSKNNPYINGYIPTSFPQLLGIIYKYFDKPFDDVIFKCANICGDNVSISNIMGGLFGLFYGYNSISDALKNGLNNKNIINKYVDLIISNLKNLKKSMKTSQNIQSQLTINDYVYLKNNINKKGQINMVGGIKDKDAIYFGIEFKDANDNSLYKREDIILDESIKNNNETKYYINDIINIKQYNINGKIKYIGKTDFSDNILLYGIELFECYDFIDSDINTKDEWYFDCLPNQGIFVTKNDIEIIMDKYYGNHTDLMSFLSKNNFNSIKKYFYNLTTLTDIIHLHHNNKLKFWMEKISKVSNSFNNKTKTKFYIELGKIKSKKKIKRQSLIFTDKTNDLKYVKLYDIICECIKILKNKKNNLKKCMNKCKNKIESKYKIIKDENILNKLNDLWKNVNQFYKYKMKIIDEQIKNIIIDQQSLYFTFNKYEHFLEIKNIKNRLPKSVNLRDIYNAKSFDNIGIILKTNSNIEINFEDNIIESNVNSFDTPWNVPKLNIIAVENVDTHCLCFKIENHELICDINNVCYDKRKYSIECCQIILEEVTLNNNINNEILLFCGFIGIHKINHSILDTIRMYYNKNSITIFEKEISNEYFCNIITLNKLKHNTLYRIKSRFMNSIDYGNYSKYYYFRTKCNLFDLTYTYNNTNNSNDFKSCKYIQIQSDIFNNFEYKIIYLNYIFNKLKYGKLTNSNNIEIKILIDIYTFDFKRLKIGIINADKANTNINEDLILNDNNNSVLISPLKTKKKSKKSSKTSFKIALKINYIKNKIYITSNLNNNFDWIELKIFNLKNITKFYIYMLIYGKIECKIEYHCQYNKYTNYLINNNNINNYYNHIIDDRYDSDTDVSNQSLTDID